MDWEFLWFLGFGILGPLGLMYCLLAVVEHRRTEGSNDESRVRLAILIFCFQYFLVFCAIWSGEYLLVPTLLIFLVAVALFQVAWIGMRAGTKAGRRIASAAISTGLCYLSFFAIEYVQPSNFRS